MNHNGREDRRDHLVGAEVVALLTGWAAELGFSALAVASLDIDDDHRRMRDWVARGLHGSMAYLERNASLRRAPVQLVPGAVSVVSVRLDYLFEQPAQALGWLEHPTKAYVSRYALGRDYHKTLRGRLRQLCARLERHIGPFGYRAFADSAPVLERALARNAGLGWIGKHTNLIDRSSGSFFFLGEIVTDLELPVTASPQTNRCGSCTRCIDACPTRAITAPYEVDARRCISYLTIESRDAIPAELRPLIGNRVFGCDDCQLVCPWNRYARLTTLPDFAPRNGLESADLVSLFELDAEAFDTMTRGSALRRVSHEQWLRNLAVALGNAPYAEDIVIALEARADHASALVREHVGWALARQRGRRDS